MYLTENMLKRESACQEELDKFLTVFPEGVKVTPENIIIAAQNGLNIWWFAVFFLSDDGYIVFQTAVHKEWKECCDTASVASDRYEEEMKPYHDAFWKARDVAYKNLQDRLQLRDKSIYDKDELQNTYGQEMTDAQLVYDQARDKAEAIYHKTVIDAEVKFWTYAGLGLCTLLNHERIR